MSGFFSVTLKKIDMDLKMRVFGVRDNFGDLSKKRDNTGYLFFLDEVPLDQINPAKYDFEISFSWSKTSQNKYKVKWNPVSIDCAIDANG